MSCRTCGKPGASPDNPFGGLCADCALAAAIRLADAILATPGPGAATLVYADGMREIGVDETEIRQEIAACDLAETGR